VPFAGSRGDAFSWRTAQVQFPMVSLEFFIHLKRIMTLESTQPVT